MLCDPKAITHFYAHESTTYVQSGLGKQFIKKFVSIPPHCKEIQATDADSALLQFGNGILVAEGENHRRCAPFVALLYQGPEGD